MTSAQNTIFDAGIMIRNEAELAVLIAESLQAYQEHLIVMRERNKDQDIEPTLHFTMAELKKHTGRERRSEAFVNRFMRALREQGLQVTFDDDDTFRIVKTIPKLTTHFTKLQQLCDSLLNADTGRRVAEA